MKLLKPICFLLPVLALTACQSNQPNTAQTAADEHSAQHALDYAGTYTGVLPCADCSGIETKLNLNKDHSFSYQQTYLGKESKPVVTTGNYQVSGNYLSLPLDMNEPLKLLVGESALFYVDDKLQPYTGKLAPYYQLKKQ